MNVVWSLNLSLSLELFQATSSFCQKSETVSSDILNGSFQCSSGCHLGGHVESARLLPAVVKGHCIWFKKRREA